MVKNNPIIGERKEKELLIEIGRGKNV